MKHEGWNRSLWGIKFRGDGDNILIGDAWCDERTQIRRKMSSEPTRALLFTTRKEAREWCKMKLAKWGTNPSTMHWHVLPVRVRETVTAVDE